MKKTIAILLVLVIGIAGVFAANVGDGEKATIKITTAVDAFAYFGLSATTVAKSNLNFLSAAGFLGNFGGDDEWLSDGIVYDQDDYTLASFADSQDLAKLWGVNNKSVPVVLGISAGEGFIGQTDSNVKIPLTVTPASMEIGAASGTTLGTLDANNIISAVAATPAQVHTALAQEYQAIITISVTSW